MAGQQRPAHAAIHKDRWRVELFFGGTRRDLKIKAFFGTECDGCRTKDKSENVAFTVAGPHNRIRFGDAGISGLLSSVLGRFSIA
jgi:hypothetical protein